MRWQLTWRLTTPNVEFNGCECVILLLSKCPFVLAGIVTQMSFKWFVAVWYQFTCGVHKHTMWSQMPHRHLTLWDQWPHDRVYKYQPHIFQAVVVFGTTVSAAMIRATIGPVQTILTINVCKRGICPRININKRGVPVNICTGLLWRASSYIYETFL